MKKRLSFLFICLLAMLSILVVVLDIFLSLPLLDDAEQARLKTGKSFWNWSSSYGPIDIHYVEKGTGHKHILLLHGFRAHTYTWKLLIEPLEQAGYHVWALDLIGFGLSDKPSYTPYTQNFFIEQVSAFMQEKQINAAHLVGNSMGGALALELALEKPELVTSLTLINALGYDLSIPYYLYVFRYLDFIWGPFLGPFVIRDCLKEIIHNQECINEEKVEAYCLPYRFPGGTRASLLTMRQFDLSRLGHMHQRFSNIRQPILIIWGDKDTLIPFTHFERFSSDLPHAQRQVIQDCGHMPQEEKPQEVLTALLSFMEKI